VLVDRAGVVTLVAMALVIGAGRAQAALVVSALGVCVLVGATAGPSRARASGTSRASSALELGAALILAACPYVAEPRPQHGWTTATAALAALALGVGVAVAVLAVMAWERRRPAAPFGLRPLVLLSVIAASLFVATIRPADGRLTPKRATASVDVAHAGATNVVLVVLDTVRADHTSLYGYGVDTTPALTELYREGGVLYRNAYAPGDLTLTVHASLLTGLWPSVSGVHFDGAGRVSRLRADRPTLAERLHDAGRNTVGIVANPVLDGGFGFSRGFDVYDARTAFAVIVKPYFPDWRRAVPYLSMLRVPIPRPFRSATTITDEAVKSIDDLQEAGAPFFLFLNYMDAHAPYPGEILASHGGPRKPWRYWNTGYNRLLDDVVSGRRTLDGADRATLINGYDAGISYIDAQLRRLFDRIYRSDLGSRTLVVVTSDHGEMFGERGVVGHAAGTFGELIKVPLLVRFPHGRRAEVTTPVSLVDIFPTILRAVDLAPDPACDGRSLQDAAESVVLSESFESRLAALNPRFKGYELAAMVDGNLVRSGRREPHDPLLSGRGSSASSALFPGARNEVLQAVQEILASRLAPSRSVVDPEALEQLRALGYLGR
jgi:arylsulfatase A-like enzyme/cytochrome c oxidase subunit IV